MCRRSDWIHIIVNDGGFYLGHGSKACVNGAEKIFYLLHGCSSFYL